MPQSGAAISRSGPACGNARRIRPATVAGASTSSVDKSSTPRMIVFAASESRTSSSRPDCAVSMLIWSASVAASSGRNE